ncbi:MAG: hypothetical protein WCG36_06120, partial [bacterium]
MDNALPGWAGPAFIFYFSGLRLESIEFGSGFGEEKNLNRSTLRPRRVKVFPPEAGNINPLCELRDLLFKLFILVPAMPG